MGILRSLFSKRACASWRYLGFEGHTHALPEQCVRCWRPCKNVLSKEQWESGQRRCEDCVQSLVHCPIPAVRRALVEEENLPEDVLQVLVTDPNGPVSMKARRRLDALHSQRAAAKQGVADVVHVELPHFDARRALKDIRVEGAPSVSPSRYGNGSS